MRGTNDPRRTPSRRATSRARSTIGLLAIAIAAAACSDSAADTSDPDPDVEQTTTTPAAAEDTALDGSSSNAEVARLTVEGVETVYSGKCSNLESIGRATYFGTGTGANGEALEMSVTYTYPDRDFEASAGFTVLPGDGSIYVESNGLQAASFDNGVMKIEALMQGTSVDGRVDGVLEINCAD